MLKNDQLDQWDRENFFHPSTHLAQHARGEAQTPAPGPREVISNTDSEAAAR